VNLDVQKGEFVFLVGLSGSGKSTFLRLVLREERPSSGTIHVAGKDLNTLADHKVPELRRQVGTVFQDFRLLPNKTIFENVAFTLHVLGNSQKRLIEKYLKSWIWLDLEIRQIVSQVRSRVERDSAWQLLVLTLAGHRFSSQMSQPVTWIQQQVWEL
jgi:ABC-type ATPase involved in cell division